MFVYPEMKYNGKRGVIIGQPIGTVTLWKASLFEHTSSVDKSTHLRSLNGMSNENGPLSVGLVVVQKRKLLNLPSNRHDIRQLYSIPVLQAYNPTEKSKEGPGNSGSKKRKEKDEEEDGRQRRRR